MSEGEAVRRKVKTRAVNGDCWKIDDGCLIVDVEIDSSSSTIALSDHAMDDGPPSKQVV